MSVWSFDYNSVSAAGSDCDAGSVRCVIANVEGEAFVVAFPDRIIAIRQNADPEHAGAEGGQIFKLGGRTVVMNVNGKAELIMIKFVIPNKSIN